MYEELIITSTVCEVLILRPTAEAVCITGISSSMSQQARASVAKSSVSKNWKKILQFKNVTGRGS